MSKNFLEVASSAAEVIVTNANVSKSPARRMQAGARRRALKRRLLQPTLSADQVPFPRVPFPRTRSLFPSGPLYLGDVPLKNSEKNKKISQRY
jgi:hypothetical protein